MFIYIIKKKSPPFSFYSSSSRAPTPLCTYTPSAPGTALKGASVPEQTGVAGRKARG